MALAAVKNSGPITAEDFADDKSVSKSKEDKTKKEDQTDEERLGLSDEQIALLLDLAAKAEGEDKQVRESLLRLYKAYHDYFRGFQDAFWDEVAHDWTVPSEKDLDEVGATGNSLRRIVNIVRAHGEALISALGSNPPGSKYFPDDAENEDDINTSKAYTKLQKLILKHNDGPLLFYKSLFILFNEGIVFAHNYSDTDESYGTRTVKGTKPATVKSQALTCPECGYSTLEQGEPQVKEQEQEGEQEGNNSQTEMAGEGIQNTEPNTTEEAGESQQEESTETPEEENQEEQEELDKNQEKPGQNDSNTLPENLQPGNTTGTGTASPMCPECAQQGKEVPLQKEGSPFEEEVEVEADEEAVKTRECINIYGFLNVKFPLYARKQKEGGYLRLAFEEDEALTKEKFPEIFDDIVGIGGMNGAMAYERWSRADAQYLGQIPPELATTRIYWFRNWYFNKLGNPEDNEDLAFLKGKYKKGVKLTLVNQNTVAECIEESLDEHWSISVDPLCNTLHADPIVKPVIPIQDVKNDVFALSVETIEHGIAETFVDSDVLDFPKYKEQRAQPGMKYPVKAKTGKNIAESFYQDKSATLNQEIGNFNESLEQEAQFVLGSFPSIYGGNQQGGSKTLGEYQQSRSQALQRLGIVWKKTAFFFNEIYKKAVPSLAKQIKDGEYDEKFVEEQGTSFINVWIRHTELTGKVGEVTPESSDQLPVTWSQRRDIILQLMQMQNPMVETVLSNAQNSPVVRDALGLDDIFIPGEDSRDKQYAEFVILLEGKAQQGQDGTMQPSVPVNDWDDHKVEHDTCISFLTNETGRAFKELKPEGYDNIVAHMKMHQMALQQQTASNLPGSPPGQQPETNAGSGAR